MAIDIELGHPTATSLQNGASISAPPACSSGIGRYSCG